MSSRNWVISSVPTFNPIEEITNYQQQQRQRKKNHRKTKMLKRRIVEIIEVLKLVIIGLPISFYIFRGKNGQWHAQIFFENHRQRTALTDTYWFAQMKLNNRQISYSILCLCGVAVILVLLLLVLLLMLSLCVRCFFPLFATSSHRRKASTVFK